MYKRFTEKRNGKNVIPLLNTVCGVDLPKWTIAKESDIRQYLSGDAVDKLALLEDKIENGTLIESDEPFIVLNCISNGQEYYAVRIAEEKDLAINLTKAEAEEKLKELKGEKE